MEGDQVELSDRVLDNYGKKGVAEGLYWLGSMEEVPYGRGTFGENS
jgi:hypothetical protein